MASEARLKEAVSLTDAWHHGAWISFRTTGLLKTEASALAAGSLTDRGW